ncbi:Uncharacterised protein g25 [Pycnogonum litorale]
MAAASPKIQQLENRINHAEQSNKALLEDLTRLQHEMKITIRQNVQGLAEERQHRQQLETGIRTITSRLQQMEPRVAATESTMTENRATMQQLVSHTKNVANAVSVGQHDLAMRKDASLGRVEELRAELNQHAQMKSNMERMMMGLKQEMVQLQTKVDAQNGQVQGINQAVQMQMRMRDEPRSQTVLSDNGMSDQVRQQLETRVMELTRLLRDMENKVENEVRKRQSTEQQINSRMTDLQTTINEQLQRRDLQLRDLSDMRTGSGQGSGSISETEKARLRARMSEVADDVTKKVTIKEQKIREDTMMKIRDLEEMILEQQEIRMKREKTIREDFEDNLEINRESQSEEIRKLSSNIKKESEKHLDAIKEIDDAVGILEQQIDNTNDRLEKIITAEAKTRKECEDDLRTKVEDCEDRLRTGMASLQVALGSTKGGGDVNHIRKLMDEQVAEVREALMNNLEDIEEKTTILSDKVNEHDELIKKRPQSSGPSKEIEIDEDIGERLDKLSFSQERLKRTLEQLQASGIADTPADPQLGSAVTSKLKTLENVLTKRLDEEIGTRSNQVHKLRLQLDAVKDLVDNPNNEKGEEIVDLKNQIQKGEVGIKKLSEAIFIVKTVLEKKIAGEAVDRDQKLRSLKVDVAKVGTRIGDNLFIKGSEPNKSNRWNLRTIYKWHTWKERWMNVLYEDPKKRERERKKNNRIRSRTRNRSLRL